MLGLSVDNPDTGNAESSIPLQMNGDGIEIGFNSDYITKTLAEVGTGEAKFEFNDFGSPTRITSSNKGWQAVLNPIRV